MEEFGKIIINSLITIITVICLLIQAWGIKKGKYDSSLTSWVIWSYIFIFSCIIYIAQEGWSVIVILLAMQGIAQIIMIFITYRYAEKGFSRGEKVLLRISIWGFIIWAVSFIVSFFVKIPMVYLTVIGISIQIIADSLGAIPYMKIVYHRPFRQPLSAWIINMLLYPTAAYGVILLHQSKTAFIFIGYSAMMYGAILILLIIGRNRKIQV